MSGNQDWVNCIRDVWPLLAFNNFNHHPHCTAGPVLRGYQAGAECRAGQLALAARPHAGHLRPRGGALDRARPAVHPHRRPPAPVVPRRRPAGRRARLATHARAPAAESVVPESQGGEGVGSWSGRENDARQKMSFRVWLMCLLGLPELMWLLLDPKLCAAAVVHLPLLAWHYRFTGGITDNIAWHALQVGEQISFPDITSGRTNI